jgi:hypothetical protein
VVLFAPPTSVGELTGSTIVDMSTPFYMYSPSWNTTLAFGKALHTQKESDRATAATLFHAGIDGFVASELLLHSPGDEPVGFLFEQNPSRLECKKNKIATMRCNSPLPRKKFSYFFLV